MIIQQSKKYIGALVILGALAVVSVSLYPVEAKPLMTTEVQLADAVTNNERAFLAVMHEFNVPGNDRSLVNYGKAVCVDMRNGYDFFTEAHVMTSSPYNLLPINAGYIMGAGIEVFCPEYSWKLPI